MNRYPGSELSKEIFDQVERVRLAANSQESSARVASVTKEAAILNALVSVEAASGVRSAVTELATAIGRYEEAAAARETANAATEARLAHWTMVMGWTTIVLAFFTFVQVVVAIIGLFRQST